MRTDRPLTLSVTEAGNLLGVSRSTAYELVRTGELASVQLRRRVLVPVAVVANRLGITVADIWLALGTTATDTSSTSASTPPTPTIRGYLYGLEAPEMVDQSPHPRKG